MPLIVEDDVKIGGGGAAAAGGTSTAFELQTAATLFWKSVPVQLRQAEREDQHEQLVFRILSGVSRANHNMRVCGQRHRERPLESTSLKQQPGPECAS
jgi:hypothetical protein